MPHSGTHNRYQSDQPISDKSNARSVIFSEPTGQTTSGTGSIKTAPWRSLFFFTTRANLPVLALAIVCSIIAGAASPAQALIIGKVFDGFTSYAAGSVDANQLMLQEKTWILYLVAIAGASWFFHSLEFILWLAFGELQAKSARDRLFHGLLEKEIEWYDMRKNGIGALLPRLQAQIRDLQLATAQPLGSLFMLSATSILSIAQAFYYSWNLTLVTLASAPFVVGLVIWLGNGMQSAIIKSQDKLNEAQKISTSALSLVETVKCFNGQSIEVKKYVRKIQEAAYWNAKVFNANGLQMGFTVLLAVSMFVQGFYYGGILISQGERNVAEVITCFMSAISGFQAIQATIPQMIFLEKGRNAGATLRAIIAQVRQGLTVQRRRGLLQPTGCRGDVIVNNVSFSYPARPGQLALSNVTLFVPAGEMTFLIGKSGSGKSTLGQLLMRFYSCSQGKISVDGVPLESLDVSWLRSNITLVEQTSLLFNDTVFRNIAFGRKAHDRVTKREVMEAAEFALLQLVISDLPDGLDTIVGYKGGSMSGGQRQRMALARARLRDSAILVLDEPTSALDHISRGLMMDAIRRWRRDKTTIIITHDISQILPDDYLYLLEGGRLVQEGYRKHLEVLEDTHFQDFLPKALRATPSPYDARKGTTSESGRTRSSSIDSPSWHAGHSEASSDPLEAQLETGESKRASLLPGMYVDGSPISAIRPYGMLGPASTMASPWLQMAASPPSASPSDQRQWSSKPLTKVVSTQVFHHEATNGGRRWSQMLERLIDTTGKHAAAIRVADLRLRPPRSDLKDPESTLGGRRVTMDVANPAEALHTHEVSHASITDIMRTVWPNIDARARLRLVLAFWGGSVHAAGTPAFAYVLSKLLATYAVPGGDRHKALIYSITILGIAVADSSHAWVYRLMFGVVSQTWVDNIRSEALGRILDQPRSFFDREENSVSKITDSLDRNADDMAALLGRFTPTVYAATFMCSMAVVWSLATQWKMTLMALVVAPYILGVTKAFAAISGKWEALSNDASDSASAIFTETFTNIKTVRALTLETHFMEKYLTATNHALVVGLQRSLYVGFFYGLSDSSRIFSAAMVFYFGTKLVVNDTAVNSIIPVFLLLIFAITNVTDMLSFIPQISSAKDTALQLLRFAQLSRNSHEHRGNLRITMVGEIVFDNLCFRYPSRPAQTILNDINLHIPPGTSTAIVGGSGSGKSTIANLLLDIYSTSEIEDVVHGDVGKLTIAGRELKYIHTPTLRSLIVPVAQTPTLFAATVADNIAYGLPTTSPCSTMNSIEAAARQAGIHDFIQSLPSGYNTLVGDGGMGLSGGQAQRVAIARALVRKPAVLVLDEATSALDVESRHLIRQTICDLVRDQRAAMTLIIITHSRDMMEIAENIVVLDRGSVVETGGFEELLARNGALANLLNGGEWDCSRSDQVANAHTQGVPKLKDVNWKARANGRLKG